jgi:hypothetical protein
VIVARRIDTAFGPEDGVLFLALWWGAGRACALADVIGLYDLVNHGIPTAAELDGGLNRLLAAGLVTDRAGTFHIPVRVRRAFDVFRRRRRRGRFTMADEFVRQAGPLEAVPRQVRVTPADQRRAYDEYSRRFRAAQDEMTGGGRR